MCLSLVGLLTITRIIGPAAYGPYVATLGIYQYAQNLGQAGIGKLVEATTGGMRLQTWPSAQC